MSRPGDSRAALLDSEATAEAEPSERLAVSFVREDADWSGFERPEEAAKAAASALSRRLGHAIAPCSEASIVLAGDALVRRLNATYRGKDAPTNVLSFPFQKPPGAQDEEAACLGDVVLAAETILREAHAREIEPTAHLQHLVVHGLLHLLGFDHDTERAAERMERLEAEVLAALGIADPYADDPPEPRLQPDRHVP